MPLTSQIKRIAGKFNLLTFALLTIPVAVAMTACTTPVNLSAKEEKIGSKELTLGKGVVLFPDSGAPSVADGGVYWKQNNCAQCHGEDGKGVSGQCDVDLTNIEWMRKRKPVDQFKVLTFGEGIEYVQPVTSALGSAEGNRLEMEEERGKGRAIKHDAYLEKLNNRQRWDLIFYSRSLAAPLLPAEERLAMKAVFGANCAVCHGSRGAGDGQLNKGLVLQPAPANFTQYDRFYDRTDEQIWDHIAHGIKWEGMPNFLGKQDRGNKVTFDADYIWHLVQYVRNFHEDGEYALEDPKKAMLNTEGDRTVSSKVNETVHAKTQIANKIVGRDHSLQ